MHITKQRVHWGEACYLCTLGTPEVAQVLLQRADHSPYYRQIIAQTLQVTLLKRTAQGSVRSVQPAKLGAIRTPPIRGITRVFQSPVVRSPVR